MIVFDTEGDNLLEDMTTLHCINIKDRVTGEKARYNDHPTINPDKRTGSLEEGARLLMEADAIAGHNVLGHDIPAIQKVFPWFRPPAKVLDTLVMAKVIWSDIKDRDFRKLKKRKLSEEFKQRGLIGRHSLEAYGYRMGLNKGDYSATKEAEAKAQGITGKDELHDYIWGTFNPEMDDYCDLDVEVSDALVTRIENSGYSEDALELEARVAEIIGMQQRHGVLFDKEAAERLAVEMTAELAELGDELREAFQPWFVAERYKGKPVIANPKRSMTRKLEIDGKKVPTRYEVGHEYCKVKLVSFEPTSRDMIADRLQKLYGWKPQEFTEGGKPKVDENALSALNAPVAKTLIKYLTISQRLGYLSTGKKSLLNSVKKDGRIYGKVNSNGARTGRMTHSDPNMNVPKVKTRKVDGKKVIRKGYDGGYGFELRSLFIAPKGKVLVGTDADGLELRMLGHYLARYDGGKYAKEVVEGDVHTEAMNFLEFNSRDYTKTFEYAYLYGSGNLNLGTTVYEDFTSNQKQSFNVKYPGGDKREKALARVGGSRRKKLEEGLPALGKLQEDVKWTKVKGRDGKPRKVRRKTLRSLDGRILQSVSQHSALNTLLQGGGAIVMKKALVIAYDAFVARGWEFGKEFAFVLNIHDEFQTEVDEDIAQEAGEIQADAIRQAGEYFNLRVPLKGSSDIGKTWAETH